jgi:hypothetical protein
MRYRPIYSGEFVLIGRWWVRISDGKRVPAIQGGTSANTVMENIWAFGDDDGTESGHSLDTGNAARTAQAPDENFLIRMMARETNSKNDPWAMFCYCSYNGGTWTELSATSSAGMPAFISANVSSRSDEESTTHRLSDPAGGTFTPGEFDDGQTSVGCGTIALNGQYSEWEFCVQIDSTYASDSDEFEFRLEGSGGTDLDGAYSGVTYPKATVSIAVTPEPSVDDGLTVGESVSASISDMEVSVSDGLTVGDTVDDVQVEELITDREIDEADGVTIADTPSLDPLAIETSISDGLTVGEIVSASLPDALAMSVSDGLTVGDSVTVNVGGVEGPPIPIDLGIDNISAWKQGVVLIDG